MTVYQYFERLFGRPPDDETLRDLLVKSPCGQDCLKVIDTGAAFLKAVDPLCHEAIFEIANEAVEIYWRG